jgi:hypothetical protein
MFSISRIHITFLSLILRDIFIIHKMFSGYGIFVGKSHQKLSRSWTDKIKIGYKEVSANFSGQRMSHGQRNESALLLISVF